MPWPKGKSPDETIRNQISDTKKAQWGEMREALDFRAGVEQAARETPDRPVSEVVRLWTPSEEEDNG